MKSARWLLRATARMLIACLLLAAVTYVGSLLLFSSHTFLGENADPLLVTLRKEHGELLAATHRRLFLITFAGFSLAWLWAGGCLLGLGASRWRPWRRGWAQIGLAVAVVVALLLQAMALQPAWFEPTFLRAGGLRAGLVELAVRVGPLWSVGLGLSPLGLLVFILKRIGAPAWRLLPIGAGVAVVAVALTSGPPAPPTEAAARPNLVLLVSDSLRGDRINRHTAPELTRLAQGGAFVPGLRVSLARTETAWLSMLSGQWPFEHGVRHGFPTGAERGRRQRSVVRAFAEAGYQTLVVGDVGSDTFDGADLGFRVTDVARFDLAVLVEGLLLRVQPLLAGAMALPATAELFASLRSEPSYVDLDGVTARLLSHLDRRPAAQPFAAVAIYGGTHLPYATPHPFYDPDRGEPHRFAKRDLLCQPEPSAASVRQVRELYDAGVRAFDHQVAAVRRELAARGLLERTVLVVMGDHGEELYDDGETVGHGDHLYGVSNRAAFIVNGPGIAQLSAPVEVRLRDVDLAPTLAELFGLGEWAGSGESFADLLITGARPRDRDVYYETGLWLDSGCPLTWQRRRLDYPPLTEICTVGGDGRIHLRSDFADIVPSAKHRAVETDDGRLVYAPTLFGAHWQLEPVAGRDDEERRAAAARLRARLVALTNAAGEIWVGDRVLPARVPPVDLSRNSYLLSLSHGAEEEGPGHYQGVLRFELPVLIGFAGGERFEIGTELDIDVLLAPGESARFRFVTSDPPCLQASLSLQVDSVAIRAVDLFTGSSAVRPFADLEALDLCAARAALWDYGGYRPPTAVWLGLEIEPPPDLPTVP